MISALSLCSLFVRSKQTILDAAPLGVFIANAPQNTIGAHIVMTTVSQVNPQILAGNADMPRARISFECYGQDAAAADDLAETVFAELKSVINEAVYDDASPANVVGKLSILPADSDVSDFDDKLQSYRRIVDFYVDWRV